MNQGGAAGDNTISTAPSMTQATRPAHSSYLSQLFHSVVVQFEPILLRRKVQVATDEKSGALLVFSSPDELPLSADAAGAGATESTGGQPGGGDNPSYLRELMSTALEMKAMFDASYSSSTTGAVMMLGLNHTTVKKGVVGSKQILYNMKEVSSCF